MNSWMILAAIVTLAGTVTTNAAEAIAYTYDAKGRLVVRMNAGR